VSLQPQQALSLRDGLGRDLGQVVVEQIKGDLVFGRFSPGPAYAEVAHLFAEQVEAANEQLLSVLAEWDAAIAALSLALSSTDSASLPAIHDVQIGAGVITFRLRKPVPDTRKTPDKQHSA